MKYSKDEIDEKLKEFLEDFPSMIGEVVRECEKRGVNPKIIEENIEEFALLCENTITEELDLSEEILGRGLTRDEVITVLTERIIKLSKQKNN
ncbi:MAG: hypothetical protein PHW84_14715 [Methanosarcina sp.]|mgnify:CR=1 FL=1|jgi:hypothetical protein|nr:hypothetical protein [Methanosarcina sp.]MDD4524058.1 hypothetical protein [Methanosarcina sp.]